MASGTQVGSNLVDELLQRIGGTVGERARASTVFGEPVVRDGITVIPVSRARFGFGAGGGAGAHGGDEGSGGGGGGGAMVSPVGYIEMRDGGTRFRRIFGSVDLLALAAASSLAALVLRRLLKG